MFRLLRTSGLSLGQKLALFLALPLAIAVLVALLVEHTLHADLATNRAVLQATTLVEQRELLTKTVLDAETGLRGFLLSGEPQFLQPYHTALYRFPAVIVTLRRMATGTPDKLREINQIDMLFHQWLTQAAGPRIRLRQLTPVGLAENAQRVYAEILLATRARRQGARSAWSTHSRTAYQLLARLLRLPLPNDTRAAWQGLNTEFNRYRAHPDAKIEAVLIRQTGRLANEARRADDAVTALAPPGNGNHLVDRIRALNNRALTREQTKLANLLAADRGNITGAEIVGFGGPLLAVPLALGVLVLFLRIVLRTLRDMTEAAGAIAGGEYTRRVPGERDDELGKLARAFNRMAERLQKRQHQDKLIAGFSEMLQTCLALDEAYHATERFCSELFPGTHGALYLINASRNLMEEVAAWGERQGESVFAPQDCRALRAGHPYVVENPGDLPCAHLPQSTPIVSLCIPLTGQNKILGLLQLRAAHPARPEAVLDQRDLAFAVAEQLALSIGNLRLHEVLRQQSIRDPLTGLFNRRYLEETLQRELARAERHAQPTSVIVLDIDHFKRVNDDYGHDAGDIVLRAVAEVLRKAVRAEDIACRYGGEEFVLLMPGAGADIARERAERVRAAVAASTLVHADQSLGALTISAGVASYPDHGDTAERLIKAADIALYKAKRSGRNRVLTAD